MNRRVSFKVPQAPYTYVISGFIPEDVLGVNTRY